MNAQLPIEKPLPSGFEPPRTLKEGAAMMCKSVKTVRRLISHGDLPSFLILGQRHVLASEVHQYIQRQIAKGKGQFPCKNT